jgi:hypothetical protein
MGLGLFGVTIGSLRRWRILAKPTPAGRSDMDEKKDELFDWAGVHYCTDEGKPVIVAITNYAPTCPHCDSTFKCVWWIDNPDTGPAERGEE